MESSLEDTVTTLVSSWHAFFFSFFLFFLLSFFVFARFVCFVWFVFLVVLFFGCFFVWLCLAGSRLTCLPWSSLTWYVVLLWPAFGLFVVVFERRQPRSKQRLRFLFVCVVIQLPGQQQRILAHKQGGKGGVVGW